MKTAVLISLALLLLGGVFGNYLRFVEQPPERAPRFEQIPLVAGDYTGTEEWFDPESYEVLKADTTTLRLYRGPDGEAYWLFVAYFASQKYGAQMHSPKHCLPGGGWNIEQMESFALSMPDGGTRQIKRLLIAQETQRHLMFYWFETRGGDLTNEFAVKWDLVKNALRLRPTDAAFVRLTVPVVGDDLEKASDRAVRFLQQITPAIEAALPFGK